MPTDDVSSTDAPTTVSRRRLVRKSALAAGALALGSSFDGNATRAQTDATPAASPQPNGRMLDFDLPGLAVGVASYPAIPTGCTVFNFATDRFPAGVMLELDVRGGSAWHSGAEDAANAICLAGGSVYGLEAAAGVAAELFAQGGFRDLVAVSGAVIYDVSVVEEPNGFRSKGIYPDKALGQAAVRAAAPGRFPLGNQGAGSGAYVGQWANWPNERERGGQGGAYRQIGPIKIAVFSVVNALGVLVDRQGQVVRGGLNKQTGVRSTPLHDAEAILSGAASTLPPDAMARLGGPTRHTTLSVLVVNVAFPRELLRQLGRQVHSSMARAIQPFHTPDDGDILFTATTAEVPADGIDSTAVGVIASELAWDAVLASFEPNP